MSPTLGIVTSTQVQAFVSSHRRDTKSYRKFNGTLKLYFRTIRQWSSQDRVDGVERIFDPHTIVPDPSMEDFRLWNMQQAYVMSVLTYTLSAGQALTVLRKYSSLGDAHDALKEIHDHYTAKGNISTLRSEFHRDISMMKMSKDYIGGPSKFLVDFQTLYLDLEEATGRTVNEGEKVRQLTAAVSRYPLFKSIMTNMELVAQTTRTDVVFTDAIQQLVRKSYTTKNNVERRICSSNVKSKRRTVTHNNYLPKDQYDRLTRE